MTSKSYHHVIYNPTESNINIKRRKEIITH